MKRLGSGKFNVMFLIFKSKVSVFLYMFDVIVYDS